MKAFPRDQIAAPSASPSASAFFWEQGSAIHQHDNRMVQTNASAKTGSGISDVRLNCMSA